MSWNMVGKMRMRDCNNATQTHAFTHTHTDTHDYFDSLFFLTKKSLSGTAGLPFSVEMMGAGLWCVDLTCTLDTGGVVGGGIDEHRPPPIVHPTWSRDWLVVWAEVDCWLWEALHPHFRGWGGCGWMCVSEQSVNVCVCVYKKKKSRKNCCIRILWQILYVCIFVHESVEKL